MEYSDLKYNTDFFKMMQLPSLSTDKKEESKQAEQTHMDVMQFKRSLDDDAHIIYTPRHLDTKEYPYIFDFRLKGGEVAKLTQKELEGGLGKQKLNKWIKFINYCRIVNNRILYICFTDSE